MPKVSKESLPAEPTRLNTLSLPGLKALWLEHHGAPLKGARREFLIRGIATGCRRRSMTASLRRLRD